MTERVLAPHESIELHEILTFKNLCLTKSVTMSPLVSDSELKSILQQDANTTRQHIKELRDLMEHSILSSTDYVSNICTAADNGNLSVTENERIIIK